MKSLLTYEDLEKELEHTGALLTGHFRLSSGLHSSKYLQCARLLQHPDLAERIGHSLAEKFSDCEVDVVAAPAIGGILVAHEIARAMRIKAIFSEWESGKMTFRRGLHLEPSEKVLVVEDVITTGGSMRETMASVEEHGGNVVGLGCIVDRSGGSVDMGLPLRSLMCISVPTYNPEECPECKAGSPIVKPGSRKI